MTLQARPRRSLAIGAAALLIATGSPLRAQDGAGSDDDLGLRVERLEAELAALRDRPGFGLGLGVWAEIYGYVKLDAAYDSARISTGNFARWVASEATNDDDNQLSLTMRQTRLGLKLSGQETGSMRTDGKVEVDFYGGSSENKPEPMLRHAYVRAYWPERDFEILAGQTSDVFSPLVAPTVNYTVAWWQGNVGYRRPQIRASQRFAVTADTELELQLALSRTITNRQTPFTSSEGDTGQDSGLPTVQSRLALTFPGPADHATLGVSGHYGEEEQDTAATGAHDDISSWSINLDACIQVTDRTLLQAELYRGTNLDAYCGGIGQGFDVGSNDTVGSYGGWCAATYGGTEGWEMSLGLGLDVAEEDDLSDPLARTRNRVLFANAQRDITRNLRVAFELSHLETEYAGSSTGDGYRAQAAAIYRF